MLLTFLPSTPIPRVWDGCQRELRGRTQWQLKLDAACKLCTMPQHLRPNGFKIQPLLPSIPSAFAAIARQPQARKFSAKHHGVAELDEGFPGRIVGEAA